MRELIAMHEERRKGDWEIASVQMALIVNLLRDPKRGRPAKPENFNPYLQKKQVVIPATLAQVKKMLGK